MEEKVRSNKGVKRGPRTGVTRSGRRFRLTKKVRKVNRPKNNKKSKKRTRKKDQTRVKREVHMAQEQVKPEVDADSDNQLFF